MKDNTRGQLMKTGIVLGLCVLLSAGFSSARAADKPNQTAVHAADNPAQAAARAVLLKKIYELDHPQTLAAPALTPTRASAPAPSVVPSMAPAQDAFPGIVVPHRHIHSIA